jgi:hypothetical protein
MDISQSIGVLLDGVRESYIADQKVKGIRSSGKSAASLRIEAKPLSGAVYGAKYFVQQTVGRKPGKFPPLDDIVDWIRAKRIKPEGKTTERQLAFLFARKIAQKGTDIFQGKRQGIDIDEQVKKLNEEFLKNITGQLRTQFSKTLKDSLQ